jgi:Na+-transporting methylmalonyl-CoA/oxaloacetate decarboxylase gamma subunit
MAEGVYVDLSPVVRAIDVVNNNLGRVNSNIDAVHGTVNTVDNNVKIVYNEVGKLANEFREFVDLQIKANRLGIANTKIVQIRQELEKKYGHHDTVRRHTTGILQAVDLEMIRGSTITTVTEELMLDAPGYWLAPCLVAIAAWINDQPELANKALREGIKRNDEKTSLFFALICRRADRKDASLKWTQRYLANQDEEHLDRKAVIILDAFASGLLGADSEGVVARQMSEWMDHLSQKPGFVEQQTKQWSDAINLKRQPLSGSGYTYLQKYSKTWPVLKDILEGAHLHAAIFAYFENIFNQESSTDSLKAQLDEILTDLVTDFDDEELPLRKEEKFEQFIIDFGGDEQRAKSNMAIEQTAFETHKDFTQLLTDAAMKPESSHASASTQKFSIALSRDWINNAYNDVIAKNRMKIPHEIEINLEKFNEKTTDGQNEPELLDKFNKMIDEEQAAALALVALTGFEQFCLWGGVVIGGIGLISIIFGHPFLGLLAIVAGIGMVINHFSKKKKNEQTRQNIKEEFENKRNTGIQIIRATLAEIVDFRAEFKEKDSESQKVTDFLEQISPDQYVKKLSDSTRRIKVN